MATPVSNASRSSETRGAATSSPSTGSSPDNRPAVDVIAVTTRDDFLLELGEMLAGQASIRPVESTALALENLTGTRRGQVVVIDTRDGGDVRGDIDQIHHQAPQAVVLVFAVAESEKQVGAAVKGSNVFAVLPLPVDMHKTTAVLEGALADAVARKSSRESAGENSRESSRAPERVAATPSNASVGLSQPHNHSGGPSDSGSKSKMGLFVGAGVVVAAIAAGAFLFTGKSKESAPPTTASNATAIPTATPITAPEATDTTLAARPAVETALVHGNIDDLLEKARAAMRERRYSEPAGDNALLYYRSAAAADAGSAEAVDGLQRVATVLASRFEESMTAGRYDEAATALANFRQAAPHDARAGTFEVRLVTAQISKALADGNLDKAAALVRLAPPSSGIPADQIARWRTEITRRQEDAKVQHTAGLVADRIRDGRLLDPADDSAKVYMQQLHDLSPASSTTQRLTRDLNAAYLRKAREAAIANRPAEVDRWLTEARAGGVSAADLLSFQRDVATARQKALSAEADRLAQLARDRIRDGRLTDPAQDSAAFYLTQLQATDASNAAVPQISRDLSGKLIDRARASAQAGKGSGVDADLTQAKHWGADPKDIAAVQQIQSSSKSGSAAASRASAGPGGANPASLATSLKRLKYVAPEFPAKALSQQIGGAVTVEFVVDAHGDPRDVQVVEATAPGVFDHAAITAVKHWHYQPVVVNGAPIEVPVRMSIRFEAPK